ncbi:MAG: hypothetical protein HC800_02785 [Phormidesmis sp. RL_2_1]|nr:hypothetical protein [Phormidesmis sp. RL_2_1]
MSSSLHKFPNAHRMLLRMSKEVGATFTQAQLQAIEMALLPRTHMIDMRLSLPLLGNGAYVVFAAGPNQRKTARSLEQHMTPTAMTDVLSNIVNRSQSLRHYPNACRMLQRMPKEIIASFTPIQIQAIAVALVPRSHVIDVNMGLPLLGKGAYLKLAAGPNRRAHYRNLQNRNPFIVPAVFAGVVLSAASIFGLVRLRSSVLLASPDPSFTPEEAFHPTVVPFKEDQQACEESLRQWMNGQCVDKDHDPIF